METKMTRLPFNLEMAKQITNGEKEGRIITKDGKAVRIICWDKKSLTPIVALIDCCDDMEYIEHYYNDGVALHATDEENSANLMLEVPEYTTFKDGDVIAFGLGLNVGILKGIDIKRNTFFSYATLTLGCISFYESGWVLTNSRLATEAERKKLIDALKKSKDPRAKGCLKMLGVKEEKPKYKFKPFDKVLGRDDIDDVWRADIFLISKKI